MPTYAYRCACGASFERILRVADYDQPQTCECGSLSVRQLCRPMLVIPSDVHFRSPVDGREITSKAAWREDMARNNCMEYDPEMKTDYLRGQQENAKRLETSVDFAFDATIDAMPSRKKELLEQELRSGADLGIDRQSV